MNCLGGEDDEGEDVTNETKASNEDDEESLNQVGVGVEPRWRGLRVKDRIRFVQLSLPHQK